MTQRPRFLILVFGLPGTGKTTFAHALSDYLKAEHLNTDVIRDRLGKRSQYNEHTKEFIYDELLRSARFELDKGRGVILDGTFYKESLRKRFTELGSDYGLPVIWVEVCAGEKVIKERISVTRPYSEADFEVYKNIKEAFEPLGEASIQVHSDKEDVQEMIDKTLKQIGK